MIGQLRSELLKLRSTRTSMTLAAAMVLLVLFFVLVNGLTSDAFSLALRDEQRSLFATSGFGGLFAALVGIMGVTSEFRHGTIRATFLFAGVRRRVVTAKVAASVLAGLVFGVVAAALAFAAGYPTIAGRGAGLALTTRDLLLLFLGTVAFAGLWGGLGCGFGALVRNQVGAIVGLLLWFLVVEALLRNVVPSVGRFAPGAAGDALIGDSAEHLLSPAAGGAVLLGWMALFALVGAVAVSHRDVP